MVDWITGVVHDLGYLGVAALMFAENLVPPLPSEVIMPLAGFVASRRPDGMTLAGAVIAGTIGAVLGTLVLYVLARRVGEARLREWVERRGRWLALSGEDIDRAGLWFARRGSAAVFIGRMIPGVRTFVSLPAGFHAMPLLPFLLYTIAGTLLWTTALALAGQVLGRNYEQVSAFIEPETWVLLAAFVIWLGGRGAGQRRNRDGPAAPRPPVPRRDSSSGPA
jgi:membrane protein DedA with SNARE-associated domain